MKPYDFPDLLGDFSLEGGLWGVRKFRYGYFSPNWLYVLDDLSRLVSAALSIAICGLWQLLFVYWNILDLPLGRQIVVCIVGIGVTTVAVRRLNGFLIRWRGGYGLRPDGSDHLVGEFSTGHIALRTPDGPVSVSAFAPHQFLMREHPDRVDEARAEMRAQAFGLGLQPDYFRRAFEVVLDHGNRRYRLAEVAFEEEARDLVRWLHELDAYARGTTGAGTRLRTAQSPGGGTAPIGKRPTLD